MPASFPAPASIPPPPRPFMADFSEGLETGLYLALLELIDEGLIITGDETIIEANSAACRLLERDYRGLAGQPLASLFPTERAFLAARETLLVQGHQRGTLELALPGQRSTRLHYIAAARIRPGIHALVLSPAPPDPATPLAAAADTVWPALAATIHQALIVVDASGRVAAANASARQHLAIGREALVGMLFDALFTIEASGSGIPSQVCLRRIGDPTPLPARLLDGPQPGWQLFLFALPSHGKQTGCRG